MVVNFRAHGINRDVRKLTRISTLNYKKKKSRRRKELGKRAETARVDFPSKKL
jgi:hypothetical protein